MPAGARQSQNCTRLVPAKNQNLAITGNTISSRLQGFYSSPLTDSNRRPPPYHRATRREPRARPGSRGHESRARIGNRPKTCDRACPAVPALVFPHCSLAFARPAYNIATGLSSSVEDARSIAPREALLHAFLTIAGPRGDALSPANSTVRARFDASGDVARVVSDVSVLCPRTVARADNRPLTSTASPRSFHIWGIAPPTISRPRSPATSAKPARSGSSSSS